MTTGLALVSAITLSFAPTSVASNSICSAFNDTVLIDYPLESVVRKRKLNNGINATLSFERDNASVNGINDSEPSYPILGCDDTMNSELKENTRLLAELASLTDDWDQCGAMAISKSIVNRILLLLPKLDRQPDLFPTPDGTIQLEYAIAPNKHLNIEILSDTSMTIFEMFADRSATKDKYELDYRLINSRVKEFYENV